MKFSLTFSRWDTKNQRMDPMGLCSSWADSFNNKLNNYHNINKNKKMNFCWKAFYHSLNNSEGLTQWAFAPLGPTFTYTTANLKKFRNFLEANQFIYGDMRYHKNRQPCHNLIRACGGGKSVCLVWIRPTENLQSHPRTSFRINERWYNKYYTHKSTINQIRLEK